MKVSPRFLVIRRDNIGDLVCTTPIFQALREHFPHAELCALVNSYNYPVLENNPYVDRIFAYTKAKHRDGQNLFAVYWDRLKLIYYLRRLHFDYVILATPGFQPRSLQFARLLKPKHIIGFTEAGKFAACIDMSVPYQRNAMLHETAEVFQVLAPLRIHEPIPPQCVVANPAEIFQAQQALEAVNASYKCVIGIHISARKTSQQWPINHFVDLLYRLGKKYGATFILLWSPGSELNSRHPGDDEKASEIILQSKMPILAYPTQELGQLLGALSLCDYLICSDGGAMHLAAALNKPILCFFGKSDAARWHPWNVPYVLLQPPSLDVKDISVDAALQGFDKLVANGANAPSVNLNVSAGSGL